jgi:DNA primase
VPEAVLYNEVNKLQQQKSFQDRNKYPGPEDLPVMKVTQQKQITHEPTTYHSERAIIRLLLKFGSDVFERKTNREDGKETVTTVADYIVNEIINDDLGFDNTVFSEIFGDYRFHVGQGLFPGDQHFVRHQDPDISRVSADLLADSHELSSIWKAKQTYVETETDKIKEIVEDTVLKFKSDKISILRKKILKQIDEASKAKDFDTVSTLQKKDSQLARAMLSISKNLGDRII